MKELIEIQNKLKVPKNQKNNFGNYKYRSAEDILEALKPLLYKHKCILNLTDSIELIGSRYYVKATAKIINSEGISVESVAFAREEESKKGMDGSQITGASSSYARKYSLNGLFAIDDVKDSDVTNTGEKPTIDEVLSFVKKTKTISDLSQVWNMYPDFHTNEKFKNASIAKRKEIENAK